MNKKKEEKRMTREEIRHGLLLSEYFQTFRQLCQQVEEQEPVIVYIHKPRQ